MLLCSREICGEDYQKQPVSSLERFVEAIAPTVLSREICRGDHLETTTELSAEIFGNGTIQIDKYKEYVLKTTHFVL